MIWLGESDKKDVVVLQERRTYLYSLLERPRPSGGPSSQEWTTDERWFGHRQQIRDEIKEIDALLETLDGKEGVDALATQIRSGQLAR